MKTLSDLFVDGLKDIYDAERRILKAMPKMAKAATCEDLKAAIESHIEETEGHITMLEQVFESCDEKVKGKKCEATVGLLEEGDETAADFKGSPAINAALVGALQKVEHYEIASYGCLREWANHLGNKKAANLLGKILDEEKAADQKLSAVARESCNEQATEQSGKESKAKASGNGKAARAPKATAATSR